MWRGCQDCSRRPSFVTKGEDLRLQGGTGSKTGRYQSEKGDKKRAPRGSHHDLTNDRNLCVFRSDRVFGKHSLITTLRDEIRQPDQQPLRLTIPREERLARVADALLDDVGDDRTLDAWARVAGMARRTFMRAFSAQAGMSFGRWRQQARLFAALEMLAQRKSVTEVAIAVGYDSVSAFIEMFRTMLGTTPQIYFRSRQEPGHK